MSLNKFFIYIAAIFLIFSFSSCKRNVNAEKETESLKKYAFHNEKWEQEKVFEFVLKNKNRLKKVEAFGKKVYLGSALLAYFHVESGMKKENKNQILDWINKNKEEIGADLSRDFVNN